MSACACIDDINTRLKAGGHNTQLSTLYTLRDSGLGRSIKIATEVIEKKRGAKPLAMVPSYCPFCGVNLKVPDAPVENDEGGQQ